MRCDAPSLSRYKDVRIRCRCEGCRAANQRYMRRYRRYRLISRDTVLIDADDVRAHLHNLHANGITYREIAEQVDVSVMIVYRLARGQQRCQPEVGRRLLGAS